MHSLVELYLWQDPESYFASSKMPMWHAAHAHDPRVTRLDEPCICIQFLAKTRARLSSVSIAPWQYIIQLPGIGICTLTLVKGTA